MKINQLHLERIQQRYHQQAKLPENTGNVRQDTMQISREAQQIKKLAAKLQELPEVRQEKVDFYKEAIAKGEYSVDSKLLARKILASLERE